MYAFIEESDTNQSPILDNMTIEWKEKENPIPKKKRIIIKSIIIFLCMSALFYMTYILIKQYMSGETVVNVR